MILGGRLNEAFLNVAGRRGGATVTPGIYLIQKDQSLVEMSEQAYESEALLQELLAKHPSILAGEQEQDTPRRWLLISREMSLRSEDRVPAVVGRSSVHGPRRGPDARRGQAEQR